MQTVKTLFRRLFVKCYCSCRELKDCSRFPSWLYQILTRTAWRYGKKQRREEPVETFYEAEDTRSGTQPLESILKKEERVRLLNAIGELDVKQRTVIMLYYYNQLSTKEISRIMGCLEGTVKSRLYTARKNLEQALKKEGTQIWKKESWIL